MSCLPFSIGRTVRRYEASPVKQDRSAPDLFTADIVTLRHYTLCMHKLLVALFVLCCAGPVLGQSSGDYNMEVIDSLIRTKHHYGPDMVKIDTAYYRDSEKVSEHYFINTTTQALERAVVQVYHTPTNSTIEYYFFLDNALARVQTQDYREEAFGEARIHYFYKDAPIDCEKKGKRDCDSYVQKAKDMISKLRQARI